MVVQPVHPAADEYPALPQRQPKAKRRRAAQPVPDDEPGAPAEPPPGSPPPADAAELRLGAGSKAPAASSPAPHAPVGSGDAPYERPAARARLNLQVYRSGAEAGQSFEYLDHTADVQLHAWGTTLREAFESVGLCMLNYMTPLSGIQVEAGPAGERRYEAEGHDLQSLLYHWLDELLFGFATDFFVPGELTITTFDRERWRIEAVGHGERFDRQRHASGTEVKAITYSAMQINEGEGDAEVFVIVDI